MFLQNIEKLAASRNMSLSGVASALGMSNNAATKWRNGAIPTSKNLQKIADFFGVTIGDLLKDDVPQAGHSIGNVSNSNVLQDVSGDNIHVGGGAGTLTDSEQQILELYRSLDLKRRTLLMMRAIELKEEMAAK